jgi:glyoxylase-like metal-dependent hydrolase (beta-lactamase superfamily II)
MKRSDMLRLMTAAGLSPALIGSGAAAAEAVENTASGDSEKGLDSRAKNGNPPVATVTPWGQHVQHDPYTYAAMERYAGLKKGQAWADGESIERDIDDKIRSGAIVIEHPPTRLLYGVWALGADGQQRVYLIDTGGGLLLVDPSYDDFSASILEQVRQLGYPPKDVKWALFTHCHTDHVQSAAFWQKQGARLFIHAADLHPLRTANDLTAWWLLSGDRRYLKPLDGPVETFEDADDLNFGGLTVRAIHTPGHTPGACCFTFVRGGKRVLLGEDVVLHFGRHAWMGNPYADWEAYLASLWKVKRYFIGAEGKSTVAGRAAPLSYDLLLPGHGTIALDMADREVDYTIMVVSHILSRQLGGEALEWIDPYPFFWDRQETGAGPVKVLYR